MSFKNQVIVDFINAMDSSDCAIGNLFTELYPVDYFYDCKTKQWHKLNKASVQYITLEGKKLETSFYDKFDAIQKLFLKEMTKIITENPDYMRKKLLKFENQVNKVLSSYWKRKQIINDLKAEYCEKLTK